jgi:hypothetical protein
MNAKKYGPFELKESEGDFCPDDEFRDYDCDCYQTCLGVAAGLNWDDFSCNGCCGQVNESLLWQVRQAQRKDGLIKKLCAVPGATCFESDDTAESGVPSLRLVSSQKSVANKK